MINNKGLKLPFQTFIILSIRGFLSSSPYTNALKPVILLPTIKELISLVPS